MKFKEKLKYISNRALVLGTVVFGSFIILAVIQLLLAYKGETPWWMAIIITIFAILFPIVFWLWIHRPYMRCEKMTDRFLDGYIFSEKEDMELYLRSESSEEKPSFNDPMLVFAGFTGQKLDQFLNAMRKQKIPKINLKAMLTEHNVKWDSMTLHDELAREHEAMNKK